MPTKLNSLPLPELRRTVDLVLALIDPVVEAMDADRAALARETTREKREALCQSNLDRVHHVSDQLHNLLPDFPDDVAVNPAAFATPSDWAKAAHDEADESNESDAVDEADTDEEDDDDAPPIDPQRAREIYAELKRMLAGDDSPELRAHAEALLENFEYAETLSRLSDAMMRFSEAVRAWAVASGEQGRGGLFLANLSALVGKRSGPN